MSKKISKFLLTFLIIALTVSSFSICFAEVDGTITKSAVTTSENEDATTTSESKETTEQEIHNGDLYLFDNNIVMDKLVDGSVFIFGSNVEITGQVNGNLFVFANTVNFNESYVRYSIFACANSVYYNGACNDLYVATNNLEMTYDSYVVRDLKTVNSKTILKAAIGRDVDLISGNVDFGSGEDIPVIYGNLRYSANKEVEIPEGVINGEGTITYTKPSEVNNNTTTDTVIDILLTFLTFIVTVIVIYIIVKRFIPNFSEKLSNQNLSVLRLLKALGIGILAIIVFSIAFVILLITVIGVDLAFILLALFILLCLVSVPVLTIVIANVLKPVLKIEKTSMFYLVLALVAIVLQGITLIPLVGKILIAIISFTSLGLVIDMYLPHKELTGEERAALEEAKKLAKENKEARKQEKLEAKEAKKQAKLEEKEVKKASKENKE